MMTVGAFTFGSHRAFTFGNGTLAVVLALGCAAEPPRIQMNDFTRLGSGRPMEPSTPPASAPSAPEPLPVSTPSPPWLRLDPVPAVRLTVPWEVGFGRGCVAASAQTTEHGVEVLGDLMVEGYGLRLKLDGLLSRAIDGRQVERRGLTLSGLRNPWHRLAHGRHRLSVFAVRDTDGQIPLDDSGQPAVSFCDFELDQGGRARESEAQSAWALLGPEGTFHGASTHRLLVQAFWGSSRMTAVGPSDAQARLVIERPDGARETHRLVAGAHRLVSSPLLSGVPAGDYGLWVQAWASRTPEASMDTIDAGEAPSETALHTITVNPE